MKEREEAERGNDASSGCGGHEMALGFLEMIMEMMLPGSG